MTRATKIVRIVVSPPASGSSLDAAVASLTSPNSWVQWNTTFPSQGGNPFWLEPGGAAGCSEGTNEANIGDYSHKAVYDAARGKVFIVGAAYNCRHYFATYNQATNVWTRQTINTGLIHIWDHFAYNRATGKAHYYWHHGNNPTYELNVDTGALTTVGPGPNVNPNQETSVHEFHAARGKYFWVNRYGLARTMDAGGTTWTDFGNSGVENGYSMASAYDPLSGTYYYGGGSALPNTLWKIGPTGGQTLVTSSAPRIYTHETFFCACPKTGHLLIFNSSTGAMYKSTDGGVTWTSNGTMPAGSYDAANARMFIVPLVGHASGKGVILFVNANNAQAWLYRYNDTTPTAYSSTFDSTENPLSDGGKWVHGAATGLDWHNVKTTGGQAVGESGSGSWSSRYADDIAHISTNYRAFAANQYAEGTVYRVGGYSANGGTHEIELLLRFQITAHSARGYEVLWGLTSSGQGYLAIVRWNGSLGSYSALYDPGAGSIAAPVNGDVLRAEISGSTIRVYRNGTQVASVTDSTFASGQPGVGFWPVDGAIPESLGWTAFTAGDL